MRRLHLHISVDNLAKSIAFYNAQLGSQATKIKEDYAQWLIDDLSLNFAISTRGYKKGLNHLGIQYESNETLDRARESFESSNIQGRVDAGAECCYMKSNKYWVEDPTGIVWENYHSMESIELFGMDGMHTEDGCCIPSAQSNTCCSSDNLCGTTLPK